MGDKIPAHEKYDTPPVAVMMLYTSYFDNASAFDDRFALIGIAGQSPKDWTGLEYKKLAPNKDIYFEWHEAMRRAKDQPDRAILEHNACDRYTERFVAERLDKLDKGQVIKDILVLAQGKIPVLMCYEEPGEFCHRHIVAKWLQENTGIIAEEWEVINRMEVKVNSEPTTHCVNNFDAIRARLRFDNPGDMYVVHVMFRVKDLRSDADKQMYLSHEETQRLIKTLYIDSLEYWDRKVPIMIDLANQNRARVYVTMTRKNRLTCNRVIAKKIIDMIDDPNVRYDHLIRSAVCGCHISDYKWWTLDIDTDTEISWPPNVYGPGHKVKLVDVKDEIVAEMAKLVDETKTRSGKEIFTIPTKNGFHVMTPPFNRAKMSYLGDNLKADAMTLAYFQWED